MNTHDSEDKRRQQDDPIARAAALVASLPGDKAARLLADLAKEISTKGEKTAPLRHALIEQANRMRPQRARRLFTSLIHPLLTDDVEGGTPAATLPLCISRADIGGIWGALSRAVFPDLAAEATALMDRLCADCLVDEALAHPEAGAMRERLRQATLARLTQLAADRTGAENFCTLATLIRDKQVVQRGREATPIGPHHLGELSEVLTAHALWAPALDAFLASTPRHTDKAQTALLLSQATTDLAKALVAANLPSSTAEVLPIALLNRRGAFSTVAAAVAHRGAAKSPRVADAIAAALAVGLQVYGRLCGRFIAVTKREEFPLTIAEDDKRLLAESLDIIEDIVEAVRTAALVDVPRLFPVLRDIANTLMDALGHGTLQRVALRFSAALVNRSQPTSDAADVAFIVGQLNRLRIMLRPTGLPIIALGKWRDQIGADVEFAVQKATRIEDEEEPLTERFRHLERIERLAEIIGASIGPLLQPSSRHTQLIVTARLDDPQPFGDVAHRLCAGYAVAVRGEIAKVRYWRNPEMVALAERAAARGL